MTPYYVLSYQSSSPPLPMYCIYDLLQIYLYIVSKSHSRTRQQRLVYFHQAGNLTRLTNRNFTPRKIYCPDSARFQFLYAGQAFVSSFLFVLNKLAIDKPFQILYTLDILRNNYKTKGAIINTPLFQIVLHLPLLINL